MRSKRSAGSFAVAGDDVYDAVRDAGFLNQFAQKKSGEGRLFGWLEDYATTRGERRAEFPGGHHEREIPGDDLSDHSDRFAQRVGQELRAVRGDRNGIALDLRGPAGHVTEQINRAGDVGNAGDRKGLAVVERFQLCELFGVL